MSLSADLKQSNQYATRFDGESVDIVHFPIGP